MSQKAVLDVLNPPRRDATNRGSTSFLVFLMTSQQAHMHQGVTWVVLDAALTRGTILIRDDPTTRDGSESDALIGRLVDEGCLLALTRGRVINWFRTICELVPLKVTHTEERWSLLAAVSTALWGQADSEVLQFLRQMIQANLTSGSPMRDQLRARLSLACGSRTSSTKIEDVAWWTNSNDDFSETFADYNSSRDEPNRHLSPIHVYVISNILRRPIIVLQSASNADTGHNYTGIYLPLASKPDQCVRLPLVLVRHEERFQPLIARGGSSVGEEFGARDTTHGRVLAKELVVPLVKCDMVPLKVRCLRNDGSEEAIVHDLLLSYLQMREVTYTDSSSINRILVAQICSTNPFLTSLFHAPTLPPHGSPLPPHRSTLPSASSTYTPYLSFAAKVSGEMPRSLDIPTEFHHQRVAIPSAAAPPLSRAHLIQGLDGRNLTGFRRTSLSGGYNYSRNENEVASERPRCRAEGCKFYGTVAFAGLCSNCFHSQLQMNTGDNITKLVKSRPTPNQSATILDFSDKRTIRGGLENAINLQMVNQMGLDEFSPIEETESSETKRCVVKGCDMFGLAENGFRCSRHLPLPFVNTVAFNKLPVESSNGIFRVGSDDRYTNAARVGENVGELPRVGFHDASSFQPIAGDKTGLRPAIKLDQSNGTSSSQPSATNHKCRTCAAKGIAEYDGYCRGCYLLQPFASLHESDPQESAAAVAGSDLNATTRAVPPTTGLYIKTSLYAEQPVGIPTQDPKSKALFQPAGFSAAAAATSTETVLEFMKDVPLESNSIDEVRAENRPLLFDANFCPFACGKYGLAEYNGLCEDCFEEVDSTGRQASCIDLGIARVRHAEMMKGESYRQPVYQPSVDRRTTNRDARRSMNYATQSYSHSVGFMNAKPQHDTIAVINNDVRFMNNNDVESAHALQHDVRGEVELSGNDPSLTSYHGAQLQQILSSQQRMMDEANRARMQKEAKLTTTAVTAATAPPRHHLKQVAFHAPEVQPEFERLRLSVSPQDRPLDAFTRMYDK